MAKVTDVDKGWEAIKKMIASLAQGKSYVKIGILGAKAATVDPAHSGAGAKEPLTNVALAVYHEFGTATIPERSFVRSTFDAKKEQYVALLRKLLPAVYEGKTTPKAVLEIAGYKAEWDMKNAIVKGPGIPPPLAPATIKAKMRQGAWNTKGRAAKAAKGQAQDPPRPLVDTGHLWRAIDHVVVTQDREQPSGGDGDTQIGSAHVVTEEG